MHNSLFFFNINADACELGFQHLLSPVLERGFGFGRVYRRYGQTMPFFFWCFMVSIGSGMEGRGLF
jgi:hypothetical protein